MTAHAEAPVALITGAAVRLGATTATLLHQHGYNLVIHCNHSVTAANALAEALNGQRQNSAVVLQADLADMTAVRHLGEAATDTWQRLDLLVNNASAFYPTPLADITLDDWDTLFASNAKGPLFLASATAAALKKQQGSIINITDLYARQGLRYHSIYTMAKAALEGMTRTLARELAPEVRVNGIAPGAILWPADENMAEEMKEAIISKTALGRLGDPLDIANAVLFLAQQATYMTGQVLHVDGGR